MDHLRTDPSYVKIERQVQSGGETGAERVAVLRLFTPQGFQIMGVTLTLRYGKYVTLRSRGRDYYAAYYGAEIITPLLESWRRPRSRALSASSSRHACKTASFVSRASALATIGCRTACGGLQRRWTRLRSAHCDSVHGKRHAAATLSSINDCKKEGHQSQR